MSKSGGQRRRRSERRKTARGWRRPRNILLQLGFSAATQFELHCARHVGIFLITGSPAHRGSGSRRMDRMFASKAVFQSRRRRGADWSPKEGSSRRKCRTGWAMYLQGNLPYFKSKICSCPLAARRFGDSCLPASGNIFAESIPKSSEACSC